MNRLPLAFFSVAALCALGGVLWGAMMGASENFTLAPAHAHLNLVGWTSLALMGTFYQLSGKAGRLGWINFILSAGGAVVMIPSLALYLAANNSGAPAQAGLAIGSLLVVAGMAVFVVSVLSSWKTVRS
jgi:hypothetical protein